MERVQEKVGLLKRLFKAALNEDIVVQTDSEGIHLIDREFTIFDTDVEVKSIRGVEKVGGYCVGRSVYSPGSSWELPDGDLVEIFADRNFEKVARRAILEIVDARITGYLDTFEVKHD